MKSGAEGGEEEFSGQKWSKLTTSPTKDGFPGLPRRADSPKMQFSPFLKCLRHLQTISGGLLVSGYWSTLFFGGGCRSGQGAILPPSRALDSPGAPAPTPVFMPVPVPGTEVWDICPKGACRPKCSLFGRAVSLADASAWAQAWARASARWPIPSAVSTSRLRLTVIVPLCTLRCLSERERG